MGIHVIRVQVDKPSAPARSWLDLLKDLGPVLTGIGTLALSIVSAYYVHTMDSQKHELDVEKAAIEETNLRVKAIEAFNQDNGKQEIAAMTLAAYGKNSLSSLRLLLSGSVDPSISNQMRSFGELVAVRWMDAGDADAHIQLLNELSNFARSDKNVALRYGAYEALQRISSRLTSEEEGVVANLMVERFGTGDHPVETAPEVANAATPLVNGCAYDRCRWALRNIAVAFASDQALQSYVTISMSSSKSCPVLLNDLDYVLRTSSDDDYRKKVERVRSTVISRCT